MSYIDLTHTFVDGMPVYPGDPASELTPIADIAKDGFTDHMLKSGMHVGTHMDAPLHMFPGGKKLSEVPLEKFFGRGCLIDVRGAVEIGAEAIRKAIPQQGDIVLILTGFSARYRTPDYYEKYPELTKEAAKVLVEVQVSVVGMDTPSPDRPPFEVHKILLGGGVLIAENLTNLEALLPIASFDVTALPAKFDVDGAPLRVIATISS